MGPVTELEPASYSEPAYFLPAFLIHSFQSTTGMQIRRCILGSGSSSWCTPTLCLFFFSTLETSPLVLACINLLYPSAWLRHVNPYSWRTFSRLANRLVGSNFTRKTPSSNLKTGSAAAAETAGKKISLVSASLKRRTGEELWTEIPTFACVHRIRRRIRIQKRFALLHPRYAETR